MPPTKTARFGLLKPSVGGDNNQWGDTLNQTLDQVDQLLAVTGTPVVADTVARDLLFPVPVVDDVTIVKSLGYQMRFGIRAAGGPNAWLPEGVLRSAGPLISAGAKGAYADGATDDSNVVTLLSGGVPASGIDVRVSGIGEWDPGTYLINGNVTLDGHHRFNQGAILKIAAGKTLTVAASALIQSDHQVFDTSLGGTVTVLSPRYPVRFEWFGAKLDGVNDDGPPIQRAHDACPDGVHFLLPPFANIRIATTIHRYKRADIVLFSPHRGVVNTKTTTFFWDGAYGGRIFEDNRCYNCTYDGIRFELIRSGATQVFDGNITAGLKLLTFTASNLNLVQGQRVVVQAAGANDAAAGFTDPLVTFIDQVNGTNSFTLHDAAITTAAITRVWIMPAGALGWPGFCAIDDCGPTGTGNGNAGLSPFNIVGKSMLMAVDTRAGQTRVYSSVTPASQNYHGQRTFAFPDQIGRRFDCASAGIADARILDVKDGICLILDKPAANTLNGAIDAVICPMDTTSAGVVFGGSNIGSQNIVRNCSFWWQESHPRIEAYRISCDSQENHEFNSGADLNFFGGNNGLSFPIYDGVSIIATQFTATSTHWALNNDKNAWGFANPLGHEIEIENAGAGGNTKHKSKIIAYNFNTGVATLADAAISTVVNAASAVGRMEGIGIHIGNSANGHGHRFNRLTPSAINEVIHIDNGSVIVDGIFGAEQELILFCNQNSRVIELRNIITEGGSELVEGSFPEPLRLIGCNITINPRPNNVFFRITSKGYVDIEDTSIGLGNVDGTKRHVYDHLNMGEYQWREKNVRYLNGPLTRAQLGYKTVSTTGVEEEHYSWELSFGISDVAGRFAVSAYSQPGLASVVGGGLGIPAVRGVAQVSGGSAGPTQGVQGRLTSQDNNSATPGSDTNVGVAVEGLINVTKNRIDQPANAVGAGIVFEATSAGNGPGNATRAFHLFHGYAPNYNGLTPTIPRIYGMRLEAQFVDGVHTPDVRAFWQEGINDPNLFSGLSTFGSSRVEHGTIYIDISAGGNATPNAAGAEEYRYRIAGAATVNNPTGVVKGTRLKLVIFNNTAGAITPTLGAAFLGAGFGAIGANKSRSRDYMYDDVRAALEPIGAVSEDF